MVGHGPVWHTVIAVDLDPDRVVVRHRDDGSTFSARWASGWLRWSIRAPITAARSARL